MSPSACRAHDDFSRLAVNEAGSPFFDHFLRCGAADWPASVVANYPGLAGWRGISRLKEQLRRLTNTRPDTPLLLANRTAQLMKLAACLLFKPCRNVLVTDLGWPVYHAVLQEEARRTGRKLTDAAIRNGVLRNRWGEDEVIHTIQESFRKGGCDGVFLSAVSHLGVRLPVARILCALEAAGPLRFVVVDGAQELNHIPTDLSHESCDLYLAGTHKWLGGFHPMGIGFYGRRQSRGMIDTGLARLRELRVIDDPLLRFSTQIETGRVDSTTETVSLMPLFSCHGAVSDAVRSCRFIRNTGIPLVSSLAMQSGWSPLLPQPELQTSILLLQSTCAEVRRRSPAFIRDHFGRQGLAITSYPEGLIRLSLPDNRMAQEDRTLLQKVLENACSS
jgi:hypothetical protein